MCKNCDGWHESGLNKRDFQHSKDGPEVIEGRPKKKSKSKVWCKGKEGREHRYEPVVWYSHTYRNSMGEPVVRNVYRWICQGCGKVSRGKPEAPVVKHDHHFCLTKIGTTGFSYHRREEIWEECCICGKHGKTYSYLLG